MKHITTISVIRTLIITFICLFPEIKFATSEQEQENDDIPGLKMILKRTVNLEEENQKKIPWGQ